MRCYDSNVWSIFYSYYYCFASSSSLGVQSLRNVFYGVKRNCCGGYLIFDRLGSVYDTVDCQNYVDGPLSMLVGIGLMRFLFGKAMLFYLFMETVFMINESSVLFVVSKKFDC